MALRNKNQESVRMKYKTALGITKLLLEKSNL